MWSWGWRGWGGDCGPEALAAANARVGDDQKTPLHLKAQNRREMALDEGQSLATSSFGRPEENDPSIFPRVVGPEVSDTLVHGQEDPAFECGLFQYERIRRADQPFGKDGVGVVTDLVKLRDDLGGKVLVELEPQGSTKGNRLSSWANSAAYARAAPICSGFKEG